MSYSFIKVGADGQHYDRMAAPVQNRLYFAGEVQRLFCGRLLERRAPFSVYKPLASANDGRLLFVGSARGESHRRIVASRAHKTLADKCDLKQTWILKKKNAQHSLFLLFVYIFDDNSSLIIFYVCYPKLSLFCFALPIANKNKNTLSRKTAACICSLLEIVPFNFYISFLFANIY